MPEPTFDDTPRLLPVGSPDADAWTISADAEAPIRFLPPTLTTYEIRDSAGRSIRVGDVISGDLTIYRNGEPAGGFKLAGERVVDSLLPTLALSAPPVLTFTCRVFGSGDGRGGNAHDRRKARRAGRTWRSLGNVVDAAARAASLMGETMNRLCWEGEI